MLSGDTGDSGQLTSGTFILGILVASILGCLGCCFGLFVFVLRNRKLVERVMKHRLLSGKHKEGSLSRKAKVRTYLLWVVS